MRKWLVAVVLLLGASPSAQTDLATIVDGRYRHVTSGIEFTVPTGWTVGDTGPSSDSGEMVSLGDRLSVFTMSVWMIRRPISPETVLTELAGAPANKLHQRGGGYNIPGASMETYRLRGDSIRTVFVGGRQGIEAMADYQIQRVRFVQRPDGSRSAAEPAGTLAMVEIMTWVVTENTRAFFFGRVPAPLLADYRPWFDAVVQSALVP